MSLIGHLVRHFCDVADDPRNASQETFLEIWQTIKIQEGYKGIFSMQHVWHCGHHTVIQDYPVGGCNGLDNGLAAGFCTSSEYYDTIHISTYEHNEHFMIMDGAFPYMDR